MLTPLPDRRNHDFDGWAVLQAVGFGTSFWFTEKMMARDPTQALPITATQCAVAALTTAVWAVADGMGLGPLSFVRR